MIKFEKVSLEEWMKACKNLNYQGLDVPRYYSEADRYGYREVVYEPDEIEEFYRKAYDDIELPKRATKGSAGYDFKLPIGIDTENLKTECKGTKVVTVPTGIRCKMDNDTVLMLYPRSGLGFKYRTGLANTVGIIDSDYYNSDNEGHIMAKIINPTSLASGKAFMQGVFVKYLTTDDDQADAERNGGFGSTDNE